MISFILSQNKNICINEKANNLKQIIKNNLKIKLIKEDMNEYNILKIITNNSKNLLNYYKIIIDNIYNRYYIDNDENLKFPQCLKKINNFNKNNQYKLMNIISIFLIHIDLLTIIISMIFLTFLIFLYLKKIIISIIIIVIILLIIQ